MGGVATYNLLQYPELVGFVCLSYLLNLNGTQQQKIKLSAKTQEQTKSVNDGVYVQTGSELFKDYLAKKWIKDYTFAKMQVYVPQS